MSKTKTPEEKRLDRQRRAKARRALKRVESPAAVLTNGSKPIEDWDLEELARGRQRSADGAFHGPAPHFVPRAVFEEAVKRFTDLAQADLRAIVPKSIRTVNLILSDDRMDRNGRPAIPASVKLDAAKWVVEHLVGKPRQRIEADISVRLEGILASALVQPDASGEMRPAIDAQSWSDDDEED